MEPFASPSTDSLYDGKYFLRYNVGAELGCEINKAHFMPYLKPSDRVLDFGCAGGDLLNALRVAEPVGVEINPAAIELARKLGIEVYPDLKTVPSASVDALISNHALEHVEQPLDVMREMIRTLKPDKLAVIVVPCDRVDVAYSPQDLDHHLYSWSASNLGNMARAAGFEIIEVSELVHRLPPLWHRFPSLWQNLYRVFGRRVFDPISRICALLRRDRTQVRLVARKPKLIEQVSS